MNKKTPIALTIAGSDSGGGAGIQADLKTFFALGVYGASVITAVTAQNTKTVSGFIALPPEFVSLQLKTVITDIGTDAIKIGMLANEKIVKTVSRELNKYSIKKIVVDPVMIAKSGDSLLEKEAQAAIKKFLIPLAYVITPNIPEAMVLTNLEIENITDMKKAAIIMFKMGAKNIVVKGGHLNSPVCTDIVYDGKKFWELKALKIETRNNHGTGCTFAAAITAQLAKGKTSHEAIQDAKKFLSDLLLKSVDLNIGSGHGPLNHLLGKNI